MDRIIKERKTQLTNVKQMLKMQGLLDQYDRQNAFLNKQVDTLLKQNIKLKQQKINNSFHVSRVKHQEHPMTAIKNTTSYTDINKSNLLTQPRKSRYEYLFDQNEIRDLKSNIKNQLKNDSKKNLSTKQVQTSTQQIQYVNSFQAFQVNLNKSTQNTPIKKPQSTKKLHQSKSSLIKPLWQSKNQQIKQFQISSLKKSKSKQKQGSDKKLQIISKSRIYLEKNTTPSKIKIQQIPQELNNQKQQQKITTLTKQFYLQKSDVLEHSFGVKPYPNIEKKVTLLESDLPSGLKEEQNFINESRMTTKLMPLSIESKQLSTNLPKNEQRSTFYHQQIIEKTFSQSKRRHSLNPSPKVDFNPTHLSNKNIQPFVLKTQEALPISSIELHRNPSEQKRKFIKIVSTKKISFQQSPKKK